VRGWIADRLDPRWRRIGSELAAQGFAGPGRPDTLRAVLHQFLGVIRRLLDEALRTGGDFELTFGYEVPEPAWVRLVTDLGDHHLAIAGRHDRTRGPEVQLAGRFSDFVALYRAAAERLVNLTASPPRERSVTERVFVELTPTFGIFAPARSETTDHQLYRWAAEQGVAQALTLPGADRVLLCLGAADRFARTLLEGAGDPAQARRAGALFQRCVLVHEHCHAMLACALDAEGRNASGPDRPDSWARARALNEALAVWMELHHVRGDAAMEQHVWKYIGAGTYPEWPYAGASRLEAQFADQGIEAIRGWIARLRQVPEMAQEDFDRVALAP
jgi:hypothetical protein